jgi:hypothetical protein
MSEAVVVEPFAAAVCIVRFEVEEVAVLPEASVAFA